jgi:cytochrome c oxidase cbb3-type subunit 2
MNPAMLSHGSPMPSYAHLFADERGEALVAYMESLGRNHYFERLEITRTMWRLSETNITAAQRTRGAALLQRHCATCHGREGEARRSLAGKFKRPPPDLVSGPFIFAPPNLASDLRLSRVAQMIKFGQPGTDMPGHEYLTDEEVLAIAWGVIASSQHVTATGNAGR